MIGAASRAKFEVTTIPLLRFFVLNHGRRLIVVGFIILVMILNIIIGFGEHLTGLSELLLFFNRQTSAHSALYSAVRIVLDGIVTRGTFSGTHISKDDRSNIRRSC